MHGEFCQRDVRVCCNSTFQEEQQQKERLTKTLRQDVLGRMSDPVIHIESRAGRLEISIIEDKKVLVLVRQALDDMRLTLGEIPNIAFAQHFDLVTSEFVHGADGYLTLVYVAPFSDTVPVQLTNAVLRQMLLGSRNVVAGRQVGYHLLSRPAAWQLSGFGVGEAPFEILDGAGVGGFLAEIGWVGDVDVFVGAT